MDFGLGPLTEKVIFVRQLTTFFSLGLPHERLESLSAEDLEKHSAEQARADDGSGSQMTHTFYVLI